jgi:DNA-binding response OmpR family regulator
MVRQSNRWGGRCGIFCGVLLFLISGLAIVPGRGEESLDGDQALALLEQPSFDLVLLDVMMPKRDGYQVLEALKAAGRLRDLPVIMISAVTEIDSVVRCIEMGAEDYLPKNFNPVLLRARIGACLEKKRLRDREVLYLKQIEEEKKRSDELLHVILPDEIVAELNSSAAMRSSAWRPCSATATA